MPNTDEVEQHYNTGSLLDSIRDGIEQLGKPISSVTVEDLGPADEFHIGGRTASIAFLDRLGIEAHHRVLDVGCGLGGVSRFAADRYGCHVTGVDLTLEYVETGTVLCDWVGLEGRVQLDHADATKSGQASEAFDVAFVMHVGMNIADKLALMTEIHRTLRPGGRLGIYDVMRVGEGDVRYPVPWASASSGSAVGTPHEYINALEKSGFTVLAQRDRREFALSFFGDLRAKMGRLSGPPPLGLHLVMGPNTSEKIANLVSSISSDVLAPIELIAKKAEQS